MVHHCYWQEDIRKQIGECLGSDYFVLPSSIHEVLILPDNGMFEVLELNAMVQEVNETQVERVNSFRIRFSSVMERQQLWKMPNEGSTSGERKSSRKSNWEDRSKRWNPWKTGESQGGDQSKKGQIQSQRIGRKTLPQYYNEK